MNEIDFALLRKKMVTEQILQRGIEDKRILDAFNNVAREEFVPEEERRYAYEDYPLNIGFGQTISQPYIVALMTSLLDPVKGEKILEIGTGSGYQSAILAYLGADVYSIERIKELGELAKERLLRLGYKVKIKIDDGTLGWQEYAPFDKIIITAAAYNLPPPLIEQLKIGGKIVAPLGGSIYQNLTVIKKLNDNQLEQKTVCGCVFVPLIGRYGYKK